jgi:xanthine dehydrogenase YagR molybdenum-binding subunit
MSVDRLHIRIRGDVIVGEIVGHEPAEPVVGRRLLVQRHADAADHGVIFVDEHDDEINPLGIKGVGEIGIVGVAAAIANAIYHATGKRIRDLPITIDKLMRQ